MTSAVSIDSDGCSPATPLPSLPANDSIECTRVALRPSLIGCGIRQHEEGIFRVTDDTIDIAAADGSSIASVPRALTFDQHVITLEPRVDVNGTTLVADVSAQEVGYWRKTSPRQRSIEAGIAMGGLIGGVGGTIVGLVVGIAAGGLLLPISLPVSLIVGVIGGMAVGGAAGASIPNSDVPDQWDYQEECHNSGPYRYCW
ncbi:hypothetical protein [Nocardia sp. NPDC019304]|uniref:hypothetical protein n=1 Tax=unclassified Nocardia TaxID=2637762 RepID=UPI0033FA78AF